MGVDLTPAPKRCTFNCIYCQLGPTRHPVRDPKAIQGKLPQVGQVLSDLDAYLQRIDVESLDVVTFSGSGEPTLNLNLGTVAKHLRTRLIRVPQVLLTNGTLLLYPGVLEGISKLDIVTVKFDGGDDATLQKINRPVLPFQYADLVAGIKTLREQTQVTIALEVMLLETSTGVSNVTGPAREYLIEGLKQVAPSVDLVQLYTPWRPPSDARVHPVSNAVLHAFSEDIHDVVGQEKLWVYGIHDARGKAATWQVHKSLQEELLKVLERRPCRIADLTLTLGIPFHRILTELNQLQKEGLVQIKRYHGEIYYFSRQWT